MHTIFIADSFSKQGIKMLKEFGFNVIYKPGLALNEKIEEVRNADGLVVRSATKVTADMFTAAKKLRLVGRAGAGVVGAMRVAAKTSSGERSTAQTTAAPGFGYSVGSLYFLGLAKCHA